jgi:hypothetical protein
VKGKGTHSEKEAGSEAAKLATGRRRRTAEDRRRWPSMAAAAAAAEGIQDRSKSWRGAGRWA